MTEAYRLCSGRKQGGTGVGGDDGGGGGGGGGRPGGAEAVGVAGRGGGLGGLHLRLARLPPLPPFPTTSHTHCINKISHCHVAVGRTGGASKFVMLFGKALINLRHLFVPTRHTFRVALSAFS